MYGEIPDVKKAQPAAACALRYETKDLRYHFIAGHTCLPFKKIQALQLV